MDKEINKQIKEWKDQIEHYKTIVKDLKENLDFKNSKIKVEDLVITLEEIKKQPNEKILIEDLRKKLTYNKEEMNDILDRLKKFGDIFDPYIQYKLKGKYVRLI